MDFPVSIVEAANAAELVDRAYSGGPQAVVELTFATDECDALFADCYLIEVCNAQDKSDFVFASPLTAPIFRLRFPQFANAAIYSDYQVGFYLDLATLMLNVHRWGKFFEYGQALITAHMLALERQAGSNKRGVPGTVIGIVNSGTVDKVSYGRDVASVMEENAGHWGMTTFGMIYIRLARQLGAGPVQVGAAFGLGAGLALIRDPAFFLPQSASEFAGIDGAWQGPGVGPW